ncbi:hypothetical protein K8I61_03175 [bacterium]|nr:hypothetical protein [bacterium]
MSPSTDGQPPAGVERRRPLVGPVAECVDLHLHSNYSDAPKSTLSRIVDAVKRREIGISLTDHNEIRGAIKLIEQEEILVLPGIEVGSRERLEFLVYFAEPAMLEEYYRKCVEPYKRDRYFTKLECSFASIVPAAKEMGGLVALPHPFAPGYKNINYNQKRRELLFSADVFPNIDMIEVINGHMNDQRNFRAFALSEMFDKNAMVGSDSHRPEDIGRTFMRLNRPGDRRGLFDLLTLPIRIGMRESYSLAHLARTSRSVAPRHLQLFFSRKHQREWMMKYEPSAALNANNSSAEGDK